MYPSKELGTIKLLLSRKSKSISPSQFFYTLEVIINSIQESVRSKVYVAMDFSNKSQGGRILDNPRWVHKIIMRSIM